MSEIKITEKVKKRFSSMNKSDISLIVCYKKHTCTEKCSSHRRFWKVFWPHLFIKTSVHFFICLPTPWLLSQYTFLLFLCSHALLSYSCMCSDPQSRASSAAQLGWEQQPCSTMSHRYANSKGKSANVCLCVHVCVSVCISVSVSVCERDREKKAL